MGMMTGYNDENHFIFKYIQVPPYLSGQLQAHGPSDAVSLPLHAVLQSCTCRFGWSVIIRNSENLEKILNINYLIK